MSGTTDESKEPISALGTKISDTVASIDNALKQFTDNDELLRLMGDIRSKLSEVQNEGTKLSQDASSLKTQLSTVRKKFGALKLTEVQEKGYPKARRDETVVDVYKNGASEDVKVNDAYRWLEEPDSQETRAWIEQQVDICDAYLSQCSARDTIYGALEENLNFPRYGVPFRKGENPVIYCYSYNSGLQNQSVLYYHADSLDAPRTLLLDPNTLSEDGTTSLKGYYFSHDGKFLCYGLSAAGSDWIEFHVKEVLTGKELDDVIYWCKFTGIQWTHDNRGFFYSRYDKPACNADESNKGTETDKLRNMQLYYHRLGSSQSEDVFLVDGKTLGDEEWMVSAGITYCGEWLELYISPSCDPVNRLYLVNIADVGSYADASTFQSRMIKVVDNFDYGYDAINNEGTVFYFETNHEASNYRIVSCDISKCNAADAVVWTEIVPQRKFRLQSASMRGANKMLLRYNANVQTVVKLVDLNGAELNHKIVFPAAGSVSATGSKLFDEGFFSFTSFLYPGSIYRYDFKSDALTLFKEITVQGFDASQFETKQVFFQSNKDGEKVPMYILSPKGLMLTGDNPTIVYGYGGFDISLMPSFSVSRVLWLKHVGGVYVSTNLRGGGEYGEQWHKAGTKDKKQNVFDDFQSAAEYLIAHKYTNPSKLAIEGGSNGGLLVAACCTQRPDLYRCGVANCGVLDMLRFHKFTIGYAWTADYGCADKANEFDALYRYSPLHNVPQSIEQDNAQYPCFMATTADHDDRVSPLHSFKFVAELQHRLSAEEKQHNPLLIRIECKSGHGSSSLTKSIELRADTMAFILHCLGVEW
eukprot:CAMPEP_0202702374 /NCGR_PEP_ID=MMETSP1385-20130828/15372_1 /ASSEMBLY_ACC=CAM_ASM_000861 /TAXON_ID=933848 /ORGANISM="Elphidium margaritaceum" /LENGTH=812 /DNA_ID=CAMNT_0049360013 /DNA_START=44 /DNA_END=2479 /DNA_ORIENTATION=-